MIGEMEAMFGAPLCERLARGVRMTPLGQSLARHARSVLMQLAEAEREFAELQGRPPGAVAVGAGPRPAFDLAAPRPDGNPRDRPQIESKSKIDSSIVLARDLIAGRHDFISPAFPTISTPDVFETARRSASGAASLVVRRGHPLIAGRLPRSQELERLPWVTQPRGTPLRRTIESLFLDANLRRRSATSPRPR